MRYLIYIIFPLIFWSCEQTGYDNPDYQLVFSDEFRGESIDKSVWNFEIGTGCQYGVNLDGWGNFENQYYLSENASIVNNEYLQIEAKEDTVYFTHCNGSFQTREYTSARLNTKNKFDFIYGKIEASIKTDLRQGIWHAFWMLPSFPTVSWPYSGELDILELSYRDQNVFYAGTLHHSGAPIGASYDYSNNTSYFDDFHLYTLEWDRASIKWYVDDVLVNTITRSSNATLDNNWPFDKEFHLILNSAVGGTLGGTPDFSGQPQYMIVDYIKVYQKIMN